MSFSHKLLFLIITLLSATPMIKAADQTDAEGYPIMYVRGEFNNWGYSDATRMERDGTKYSITMAALNGKFKIGGSEWNCNLGGDSNNITVSSPVALTCLQDGFNLIASNLSDVTISFTLQRNGAEAKPTVVTFAVEGRNPDDIPIVDNTSGTLPVIHINVYKTDADGLPMLDSNGNKIFDNEIISYDLNHKNYFAGEYWLDTNDCQWMIDLGAKSIGSEEEPLPLEIKARGNWTRIGFSKKPFKIKLGKKQNLLGLTPDKSKHYALLAHADDNYGYLRNFTGFSIGKRIGLPWTPSQQPIEVIINGDYRGLYFLTESIRVGDGRINITELDDLATDPALISGGYLVELDNYDEENQIKLNEKACIGGHNLDVLRITFDTPEEYSDMQRRFVTDQFTAMNDFVGANSDELWSYLDLDDAARYYLAREIVSDVEAYHGSTYLFRDNGQDQKWHFSPIWDCGNAFNGRTDKFFYECDPFGNTWIPSMSQNSTFIKKVQDTWKWFMSNKFDGLYDEISDIADKLTAAAKADRTRWNGQPTPSGGVSVVDNTNMASRRNVVLAHLKAKTEWLTKKFGAYSDAVYQEPERDNTPAAPLPEYAMSGIVEVETSATEVPAKYYDLTGRYVATPVKGQFYILRRGDNVSKVIY